MTIKIQKTSHSRLAEVEFNHIDFGKVFSDHLFIAEYKDGEWQNPTIKPFEKLSLSPANLALHYGQSIFEGMKVTADENGEPLFFRLDQHIERINHSAWRMAIPEIPEELFRQAVMELVMLDKKWIPSGEDSALYVRPFVFAADEFIGVRPSDTYKFIVFTCPVNSYYTAPVKVITAERFVRAFPGGTGDAKVAGNYGATLRPMQEARKKGYDQLVWLDGINFNTIQECGTMNLFFIIDGTVITPLTDGTVLEGITRDSIITILQTLGYPVETRHLTMDEVVEAYHAGTLQDVFGTGTAAVVSPIIEIKHRDLIMTLPPVETRTISRAAKQFLVEIRQGKKDPFGWMERAYETVAQG